MIVGDWKPIETILDYLAERKRILIAGCNGCVTVCNAGGQKEVDMLARILDLAGKKRGRPFRITKLTVERQCDPEFLPELLTLAGEHDAVLSMACGAGVQLVAERAEGREVFPALDTTFIGVVEEKGHWGERCQACGDCKLVQTGGICPVTRCSKSLMNGPCGGSRDGKCEVDPAIPCGWNLIIDRLEALGRLDQYEIIQAPADWSKSRDGGPRMLIRKDLQ